jgi:hypothetical protein
MSIALRVRPAPPAARLRATTAVPATLAACGGEGMGTAPMSGATDVMTPADPHGATRGQIEFTGH